MSEQTSSGAGALGIDLEHVTKRYPGVADAAVLDFSMSIEPGELVVFVGPSGCGKTTTMKMVNRLIEPTSGRILLGGRDVLKANPVELRRQIGYVIQSIGLFPHMTVADNVGQVPKMLGWSKKRISDRVDELLELVGLEPSRFARRYPRQLSGGQAQRVGVARALAADPPVLLMDEPFGATDPVTRVNVQREFRELQQRLGKTVIFVTHDFDEALILGDRIAVLAEQSRIVQFDTALGLVGNPADDHVSRFVGATAHVRLLGLISAGEAADPGRRAPRGAASVSPEDSLRVVVDALLGGHEIVSVRSAEGAERGVITFAIVQQAVDAAMRGAEPPVPLDVQLAGVGRAGARSA